MNNIELFRKLVKNSWTWEKCTFEEKQIFLSIISETEIKGCEKVRHEWFNSLYSMFLYSIGYTGHRWRASETEEVPLF